MLVKIINTGSNGEQCLDVVEVKDMPQARAYANHFYGSMVRVEETTQEFRQLYMSENFEIWMTG
jgi:hypothetical protein